MTSTKNFNAYFTQIVAVKIIIAIVLYVWCTNTCISHNGTRTSWLTACCSYTVAVVVLCVIPTKLVSHFMSYIVDVKRVSYWR